MKTILPILIALVTLVTGCSFHNTFDRKYAGHTIPGHLVKNQCYPYAVGLHAALLSNNVQAVRVTYDWVSRTAQDRHTVVLFRKDGKLWCMDNEVLAPKVVTGTTDIEAVQSFDRTSKVTTMVDLHTLRPCNSSPLDTLFIRQAAARK